MKKKEKLHVKRILENFLIRDQFTQQSIVHIYIYFISENLETFVEYIKNGNVLFE
jgi:hypothetical protein